jgi:hypothetical protein
MRLSRWITAAITAIAAFAVAGFALAASGPIDVSGLSPFAACTVGGPGTNSVNSEVEPFVAVKRNLAGQEIRGGGSAKQALS